MSRLGVKSVHVQTEISLFLPSIQHWKNCPYYSKFYLRIISAGLVTLVQLSTVSYPRLERETRLKLYPVTLEM